MADDPVLARRARIAAIVGVAQRVGYGLYGAALVAFMIGLATGFTATIATIAVSSLVAGSILLAPAIILGYAVRAADRADREDDW